MKLKCLAFTGLLLIFFNGVQAQWCCIDTNLTIKDKTTQSLRLRMSGAVNNDLANPLQGVCGVRVKFKHKFVGDVTMDLLSPSGQRVRLIGPIGASGNTNFTTWNVTFVRCKDIAVPDVGFSKKWDNQQPWGIFGNFYNGTYYPESGCLEDFNMGSVNGQWVLSIIDNENLYEGSIESFCILFCDPNGINCSACNANGGFFSSTDFSYCEGDTSLNIKEQPDFQSFVPDTAQYSYTYIIIENDRVLSLQAGLDVRAFKPGSYTICGLSYLKTESSLLPKLGDDAVKFRNELIANTNDFCAELSKNCLNVQIFKVPAPEIQNVTICKGESVFVGSQQFDLPGIYNITLQSAGGCDSLITLHLDVVDIKLMVEKVDTITCFQTTVVIDISKSLLSTNSKLTWNTLDGNILDQSDSLKIIVNKKGTYTVKISAGSCADSIDIFVPEFGAIPEVNVSKTDINCANPEATLTVNTNVNNPGIIWKNNGLTIGLTGTIKVSQGGRYFVTVTDANGCSNGSFVDVLEDKDQPKILLDGSVITCKLNNASINLQSTKPLTQIRWTGPNSYTNDSSTITVNNGGLYSVIVTGENGCTTMDSIRIFAFINPPHIQFKEDTIKCNVSVITIEATSTSILDTILYNGPGNFTSTELNPIVSSPGIYFLRLVDSAGCAIDTFIRVHKDTLNPDFTLQGDLLDCFNDSVQIKIQHTSSSAGFTYKWSGPVGFFSTTENPWINEKGTYVIEVTSPNGCVYTDSILIDQDKLKPEIDIIHNDIDCLHDTAMVSGFSLQAVSYRWTGPNQFVNNTRSFTAVEDGLYTLVVTSANGCTAERSVSLLANKRDPIQGLKADTLTCKFDTSRIQLSTTTIIDTILWTGPNGFVSDSVRPLVRIPGWYFAYAKGRNGCSNNDSVFVAIDTIPPLISLEFDTITCLQRRAFVRATFTPVDSKIEWTRPDSVKIKRDAFTTVLPGTYTVEVTGINGCIQKQDVEIVDKTAVPFFTLSADTLTCRKPIDTIITGLIDPSIKYNWNGPGFSNLPTHDIIINTPGKYILHVINEYGCSHSDSMIVYSRVTVPKVNLSNPEFNCLTVLNPRLIAMPIDPIVNLKWTFPDLTTSNNLTIVVNQAGAYLFEMNDSDDCFFRDTLVVKFDTVYPKIIKIKLDSINCLKSKVIPFLQLSDPQAKIKWIFPNQLDTSNALSPTLTEAGFYRIQLKSKNECSFDSLVQIVVDTSYPTIQAIGGKIDCKAIRIKLNLFSSDTSATFFWQDPNGIVLHEKTPNVDKGGLYIAFAQGDNGCLAFDSVTVLEDRMPPSIMLPVALSFPCNSDSVQIIIPVMDSIRNLIWRGPNGFASSTQNPFVHDTGVYIVIIEGSNFCAATDSVSVNDKKSYPDANIVGEHLTCALNRIQLQGNFDKKNKFVWSGPQGVIDSVLSIISVTEPGIYHLKVINDQFCETDTSFIVQLDTVRPSFLLQALDSVTCDKHEVRIRAVISDTTTTYNFAWSANGPTILSASNLSDVFVRDGGQVELKVTNQRNGCESIQKLDIIDHSYSLKDAVLEVTDPNCSYSTNGSIKLIQIYSGKSPYRLSIDGINFMATNQLGNLKPGNYTIYIKDSNGCLFDSLFQIGNPTQLYLDLGANKQIQLGQSVDITPVTNTDTSLLQNLTWLPPQFLNCVGCFSVTSTPLVTTRYTLVIIDEAGCKAEDDILIRVNTKPKIYIPSVFSPNNDNINDDVRITSGNDIAKIYSFQVYDRWGSLVYSAQDILTGPSIPTWDGTFEGKKLNPGVFVYKIDFEQINGIRQILSGDITLLK